MLTGSRLSRFTAENQYGMVGFGAGPVGSTVASPDSADAAAGISSSATVRRTNASGAVTNLVMPAGIPVMEDPTFWMIVTLGAVIGLAAYSAGPSS